MTVAVIEDPSLRDLPLAALLQEKIARPGLRFVDRDAVEHVLAEQTLQAAFDAGGGASRARLGSLLKADELILLRRSNPGADEAMSRSGVPAAPRGLDVVVCETARGLRLAAQVVPIQTDPAAAVAALDPIVTAAVRKGGEPIRDVVAVPPFVSNDLSYRYESLKSAYARALEQMLADDPRVCVVELEEARAIAREAALAGERTGGVRRPLPLYLLGEFRNSDERGDERTVSLKIVIRRGEQLLGEVTSPGAAPADVPAVLREAATRALAFVDGGGGSAATPPEEAARAEAAQLGQRSRLFSALGNWTDSLALAEASLLLNADQVDMHHDAVIACGKLTRRTFWAAGDKQTPDQIRRATELYLRGLDHLEAFLRRVPDLGAYRMPGQSNFIAEFRNSTNGWGIPGHPSRAALDELEVSRARERDAWLRIARVRARDRRGDEHVYVLYATTGMPDRERYALQLDLLKEWQDLPGTDRRVREFAHHGYTIDVLDRPEGQKFLAALARSDNAEIRAAGAAVERELKDYTDRKRDQAAAWKIEEARRKAEDAAARSGGPADVLFEPLTLTATDGKRTFKPSSIAGCTPAGPGVDAVWTGQGAVYLMKEPGKLRSVWQPGEANVWPSGVAFDGRYLWAAVRRHGKSPRLLVIDPASEQVWDVTEADGLPAPTIEDPKRAVSSPQTLRLAAIEPGRVCVAGYFGRTWLAIAQVDPVKGPAAGPSVKVFHEARAVATDESATQWRDAGVIFQPGFMRTLTDPASARDARLRRTILIGRGGSSIKVRCHPLLVDADTLRVRVVEHEAFWEEGAAYETLYDNISADDAGVYWVWPGLRQYGEPAGPVVHRLGFPDFQREALATNVYTGRQAAYRDKIYFHDGRCIVAARQWWVADTPAGPFRMLRGDVPERLEVDRPFQAARDRPLTSLPEEEREAVISVHESNLYGLVCRTSIGRTYRVTFARPSGPAPAKP